MIYSCDAAYQEAGIYIFNRIFEKVYLTAGCWVKGIISAGPYGIINKE